MKKLLSILLAITMVFYLAPMFVYADEPAEPTETIVEQRSFHAPTIRSMIDSNLALGNVDEEFYHLLANAYLTDPVLLCQTISDLSADEITYLAKAISYDLQKTERTAHATLPDDCGTPEATAVANAISAELNNPANGTLAAFMDPEMAAALLSPTVSQRAAPSLTVRLDIDSSATHSVAAPTTISVFVGTFTATSSARTFYVDIHKELNDSDSVATCVEVTVPANALSATAVISVNFSAAGDYTLYAVARNNLGTVSARSVSQTLSVNGKWHITVELTADRYQLGTITLYNASGSEVSNSVCLGRAEGNLPMNQTDGNTPIGVYSAHLDGTRSNTTSYGPYQVIRLIGESGYVVEECSHRSGLLIHGGQPQYYEGIEVGDPNFNLCVTHGCVRVTNDYQKQLKTEITALITNNHEQIGIVTITQDGQITL